MQKIHKTTTAKKMQYTKQQSKATGEELKMPRVHMFELDAIFQLYLKIIGATKRIEAEYRNLQHLLVLFPLEQLVNQVRL